MKKIMFSDKYGLTEAVLSGNKTQTRRVMKIQPPYKNYDAGYPVFNESNPTTNPLWESFCWYKKGTSGDHTKWIKPHYHTGEIVTIAQSYADVYMGYMFNDYSHDLYKKFRDAGDLTGSAGWNNKMFVKAEYMPHHIQITYVGVRMLQGIPDKDCIAEGISRFTKDKVLYKYGTEEGFEWSKMPKTPREAYAMLIDKISGIGTWVSNPWVWKYEFKLID